MNEDQKAELMTVLKEIHHDLDRIATAAETLEGRLRIILYILTLPEHKTEG